MTSDLQLSFLPGTRNPPNPQKGNLLGLSSLLLSPLLVGSEDFAAHGIHGSSKSWPQLRPGGSCHLRWCSSNMFPFMSCLPARAFLFLTFRFPAQRPSAVVPPRTSELESWAQGFAGAQLQAGAGGPWPYLDTRVHAYALHTRMHAYAQPLQPPQTAASGSTGC